MDQNQTPPRRKLIEASIPLEKINEQSAREKSIRHGHPSTMHLWWSRKPTATARAVLFSQIVDDPTTRPDLFPTVEEQEAERRELFTIIEQISNWDVVKDDKGGFFDKAREKIQLYTGGNPPPVVDPFAGGGSIPLEAQRLGLEAHASDVNPVAVLLEKALIEIPAQFADLPPVHPVNETESIQNIKGNTWKGASGLAEDVRYYGEWMLQQARQKLGYLYPTATLKDGTEAPVIAWLWARTVKCPNPTCGIDAPLTSSWWVSKKKGREAFVRPLVKDGAVSFEVIQGKEGHPTKDNDGTVNRSGAKCVGCGSAIPFEIIREAGREKTLGQRLMAIVAAGNRQREYLSPTGAHEKAALVKTPSNIPGGQLPDQALGFRVQAYGFQTYSDLFSARQLTGISALIDLLETVHEKLIVDGAEESYSSAIKTMLTLVVSRCVDRSSSFCSWDRGYTKIRNTFSLQALPMIWDFAESMPLSDSSGGFSGQLSWVTKAIQTLPAAPRGSAHSASALTADLDGKILSTDPPYYDYIGYSDLSDFSYVWMRRSLRSIYPELFNRMLVPKTEELVANPFRHGGKEGARKYFEEGFIEFFAHARSNALPDYPITVYYAFKQQDSDPKGSASTGWETVLEGMIRSGWQITATWPMRSEMTNRSVARGTNALASSIALVLRPRSADAEIITRAEFLNQLKSSLPDSLRDLQKGTISPVDLPQSAIGPGMGIFSKYNGVLESDGRKMTVRSALAIINEILDEVLAEQEGDYDSETRFALAWFRTYGFESSVYGDADNLARARNTSIDHLVRSGILDSGRGEVHLLSPAELYEADQGHSPYDPSTDNSVSAWETVLHLAKELEFGNGVEGAGKLLALVPSYIDGELCKQLAFLLFTVAEARGESKTALLFNQLGTAWNDIEQAASKSPGVSSPNSFSTDTLF